VPHVQTAELTHKARKENTGSDGSTDSSSKSKDMDQTERARQSSRHGKEMQEGEEEGGIELEPAQWLPEGQAQAEPAQGNVNGGVGLQPCVVSSDGDDSENRKGCRLVEEFALDPMELGFIHSHLP